ncbi:type VI secretion system contractile sheath large subunit [Jannaschia sp. CCS1]|uniref:type VI secretion system contractile sheath large subunit n=1 Tax=Jannaschia sp. (strain CCS1) TaxID=290400 RepID=UPI000053A9D0|nr:type VI secretion system contractile sheath large subunit [Jannaschia sp. CCS1]ABD55944.1 protein of unknown function DUF877 [Jannaschia sp. CCS1]
MTAPMPNLGAVFDTVDPAMAHLAARIDRLILAIDAALTRQLNAILAASEFRALEARWRALDRVLTHAGRDGQVIVRILNVSWRALSRDLDRAVEFDQSHLHKLVYDGEFGMPGGLPFGVLVADYEVSATTDRARGDQVETLSRLAAVAAAAFCPIMLGAAPDLLGVDDFDQIAPYTDLTDAEGRRADPPMIRWRALRDRDDARFIGLVAPRIVLRGPRTRLSPTRADGFTFDEDPHRILSVAGSFAFATTVIAAFRASGWFAAIRGAAQDTDGGGRVAGWPGHDLGTDGHNLSRQSPATLRLTAAQEDALIARGIVPLSSLPLTDEAVFNANPSLHRPTRYDSPVASENARISAMLQYVLCTSRFAHYLKVMMREAIGSVAPPDVIQGHLDDWLRGYCLGNEDAGAELKAEYPLRNAGVEVTPIPGKPGAFAARIHLQPHFQLDDISTSFHLVSEAPAGLERTSA